MSKDADMHPDISTLRSQQRQALGLLLERHSPWPLTEPAPSAQELDLVFQAALRAPDHGQLQPWRFVVIRGDARLALGNVFAQAAQLRDPLDDGERFRGKAMAAPVLIAICARVQAPHKVPESEQVLAVGAAAMNMLNALHLLGYGGFWATGLNSYDRHVQKALGLQDADRLLGFLYAGTPKEATRAPERHAPPAFVREWTGESAAHNVAETAAAR
ncbi:nitroreductase [Variovorax sp. OK202]|uniref:nitroreductase family protein n=1 Tax=unclassified Variovorax TaxID=663243 RepID=UPI003527E6F6